MHHYSIVCKDEIHKDGVLMTPEEIVEALQIADMIAEFTLMGPDESVEMPDTIKTSEQFINWLHSL